MTSLRGRSFLTLMDYTPEELTAFLDLAADLKQKKTELVRQKEEMDAESFERKKSNIDKRLKELRMIKREQDESFNEKMLKIKNSYDGDTAEFEKQKAELARQEAETGKVAAELKALQNQISPHVMLNTLNNIYALIAHK